jgi:23S rRNA maturation mini-RNase III
MAKELPYFKFEPNQWENGNIQMLSREDKGLFIDLCSMYWSRLGDVPLKLAIQKLCAGNATALNSLCDEKIIEVLDDNIFIKFLSEQLNEFEDTSKQNSKNAKEGWEKRRKLKDECERNASASNPQCENDAIREDKIKEDKINSLQTRSQIFKDSLLDFKNKYQVNMLKEFYNYWTEPNQSKSKMRFELEKTWSLDRRLETWAKRENLFNVKPQIKQDRL